MLLSLRGWNATFIRDDIPITILYLSCFILPNNNSLLTCPIPSI